MFWALQINGMVYLNIKVTNVQKKKNTKETPWRYVSAITIVRA